MPTILNVGPYRFFFFAGDGGEPVHVHIENENKIAKFWIEPVRLAQSGGFNSHELNTIQRHVNDNKELIIEKWNEYFNK